MPKYYLNNLATRQLIGEYDQDEPLGRKLQLEQKQPKKGLTRGPPRILILPFYLPHQDHNFYELAHKKIMGCATIIKNIQVMI